MLSEILCYGIIYKFKCSRSLLNYVPHVLSCLTFSRAVRALCPTRYVLHVLSCLTCHTCLVPYVLLCLMGRLVPYVLLRSRASYPTWCRAQRASCPTCSCVQHISCLTRSRLLRASCFACTYASRASCITCHVPNVP